MKWTKKDSLPWAIQSIMVGPLIFYFWQKSHQHFLLNLCHMVLWIDLMLKGSSVLSPDVNRDSFNIFSKRYAHKQGAQKNLRGIIFPPPPLFSLSLPKASHLFLHPSFLSTRSAYIYLPPCLACPSPSPKQSLSRKTLYASGCRLS